MRALGHHVPMTPYTTAPTVLIRAARGSDGPALARLAALDSRPLPAGDLLVAEADGELVAALDPASGRSVADPFRRTADLVALLALRGQRLGTSRPRRTARLRPVLHARAA
jgi:hypothetical protein